MLIFDPSTLEMVSWYTAPPSSSTATFAGPTQADDFGPKTDSGSTGTMTGNAPSGIDPPSDPSEPGSDTTKSTTLAIALGTTFGFLGIVAGVVILYYAKRTHDRNAPGKFVLLNGDLEDKSGSGRPGTGAVPVAGSHYAVRRGINPLAGVLVYLGIHSSRRIHHQPRRDMFADEDTRSITWGGLLGASRREGSDVTSAWSLRSMGAMVRSAMSREPSASGTVDDREERLSRIGGVDHQELMASVKHPSQARLQAYTDPFADPLPEDNYPGLNLRRGTLERDDEYDRPTAHDMPLDDYELIPPLKINSPITFPLRTLSPLKEVSHASSSNLASPPHLSLEILQHSPAISPSERSPTSPTAPRTPYTPTEAFPPRLSLSIPYSPPSQPIRRSDSWWTRFAKTPLLERRGTASSSSNKLLDFRDPAPAPPLGAIEESFAAKTSLTGLTSKVDLHGDVPAKHVRTISSVHSMRTADTDSLERLGGNYDVVQRIPSEVSLSRTTVASSTVEMPGVASSGTRRTEKKLGLLAVNRLSTTTADESILTFDSFIENSLSSFPSQTLVSADSPKTPTTAINTRSQSPLVMTTTASIVTQEHSPSPPAALPTGTNDSNVGNKVRAYERRLSQDWESQLPSSPRNTRSREEVPSRSRPTIKYGLAPHASLYIANPDISGSVP